MFCWSNKTFAPAWFQSICVILEDSQLLYYKIREKTPEIFVPKLVSEYSHLVLPDLVTTYYLRENVTVVSRICLEAASWDY